MRDEGGASVRVTVGGRIYGWGGRVGITFIKQRVRCGAIEEAKIEQEQSEHMQVRAHQGASTSRVAG